MPYDPEEVAYIWLADCEDKLTAWERVKVAFPQLMEMCFLDFWKKHHKPPRPHPPHPHPHPHPYADAVGDENE